MINERCLKKYCDCFNTGIKCSDLCNCQDCKNQDNLFDIGVSSANSTFSNDTYVEKKEEDMSCYEILIPIKEENIKKESSDDLAMFMTPIKHEEYGYDLETFMDIVQLEPV